MSGRWTLDTSPGAIGVDRPEGRRRKDRPADRLLADAAGGIGYGMITGRDLERTMAMAVVDLAVARDVWRTEIEAVLEEEQSRLAALDHERMRRVEATRVEMETF
jgi:alpha-D-ribose 1-methylphosphonate 5-triphosphate synthase subunit PhnG